MNSLARASSDVIPVYFDAWRYEKAEHIIVPILHRMHTAIRDAGDEKVADHLQRAIRSVIYSLNFSVRYVGGVELKPKDIAENWQSEGLPALDEAFSKPFNELSKITQALGNRRIVVLIDDLDRCSPDKVVSVLESINLVMDVPGLIFVLALDYDVLVSAITQKYPHVSGDSFIQKMVQLPFRVPPLSLEKDGFLSTLIPTWRTQARDSRLPAFVTFSAFSSVIYDIATLGLDANPRQIKRLINSFLLLQRVVTSRFLDIDLKLLAALIGVQLRWPEHYYRFQEAVVIENADTPLSVFRDAQDTPALVRYAMQLLNEDVPNETLDQILHLTAVVVADQDLDAADLAMSPAEQREHIRAQLIAQLKNRDFEQSSDGRWYFNISMPDVRLRLTHSCVIFERRQQATASGKAEWIAEESYSLANENEVNLALRVLDEPAKGVMSRR
jgi:hypothetical protein